MCFVNDDCDWTATIEEKSTLVSDGSVKCTECGCTIPAGETVHHVYQQECEECKLCENGDCECPLDDEELPVCIDKGCQCEQPNFGETFDYDRCEQCDKLLRAIEASEIAEGCAPSESRPLLGVLFEDLRQAQEWDGRAGKRYVKQAVKMFPELVASGYLKRIWAKIV